MRNFKQTLLIVLFISASINTVVAQSIVSKTIDTTRDVNFLQNKKQKLLSQLIKLTDTMSAKQYIKISDTYFSLSNRDSSYYYDNLCYQLCKKINFKEGLVTSLKYISEYYELAGNYSEGAKKLLELKDYLIKIKDTGILIGIYQRISDLYRTAKDYNNQLLYAKETKEIAKNYSDKTYADLYLNDFATIGDAYQNLGMLDSALVYFQQDYATALKINNPSIKQLGVPTCNLGEINLRNNNYEIALAYFRKAKNLFEVEKFPKNFKVELFNEMAICFEKTGNLDSALSYTRKAYEIADKNNIYADLLTTSQHLFKLFEKIKKIDSAYFYQNKYLEAKELVSAEENTRQLERTSIQESIRKSEIEEQKNKENEERETNLKLGLIAIFIPTFSISVFTINKKRKVNSKLITTLGLTSLLMLFEFISLLIHPLIEKATNHDAILMYLILIIIASFLVPLHHKLESYVKSKL